VRQQVVSILLAKQAEMDDRLIAFRNAHLPDGLLAWGDVREWISRRAKEAGKPTRYVEVPLPEGSVVRGDSAQRACVVEPELQVRTVSADGGVTSKLLKFGTPDGRGAETVATVAGSVLDELRLTIERLAGRFEWTAEQAAVFVLTGITPLHALVRTSRKVRPLLPVVSRIELSVDPSVTPEELAEYYRVSRARMMPGRRHRSQSRRAMQLAIFAAGRDRSEDWEVTWRAWNERVRAEHPDWEYKGMQKRNFPRDLKAARTRVLFPPYVDPSGQGRAGKDHAETEIVDVVVRISGEDDR
jgi:hypothetical protein